MKPEGTWRGVVFRIGAGLIAGITVLAAGTVWVIRQPGLGGVSLSQQERANPAALEAHVRFLTSTEPPRTWGTPSGLAIAAGYIAESFAGTGAAVSEQPYWAGPLEASNVIARFGPAEGARVVVGAHYDVFGELPGADDNASGIAGLLELARLLGARPPASPVELVAYSTEEPPFFGGDDMGSAVHARSLARAGVPVRAMISLEMIGYFAPSQPRNGLMLDLLYPRTGDFVAVVGRWSDRRLVREVKKCFRGASDVPAVSYTGPLVIGADLSDHRSYWKAGYSAVMVTDTAFLRNPNYHTADDTADSLDYRRLAGVVDGVFCAALHLARTKP